LLLFVAVVVVVVFVLNYRLPCRMEEEAEFRDFAAQPNVTQQIFERMAPNIFGHDEIKKAVACLLFGGARKVLHSLLLSLPPRPPPLSLSLSLSFFTEL
jgi:hypothetical protein